MKNYFGVSMLIWGVAFALALLVAWPVVLQNSLLLTTLSVDRRFLISVFYILFNPSSNVLVWVIWLIAGFLGGLLIKGIKSGILVSAFSVGVLFLIFELLVFPVQALLYSIFDILLSPIWVLSVIGVTILGGCLGGFIRKEGKEETADIEEMKKEPKIKCPACGQEFDSNPLICSYCGAKIRSENQKV